MPAHLESDPYLDESQFVIESLAFGTAASCGKGRDILSITNKRHRLISLRPKWRLCGTVPHTSLYLEREHNQKLSAGLSANLSNKCFRSSC